MYTTTQYNVHQLTAIRDAIIDALDAMRYDDSPPKTMALNDIIKMSLRESIDTVENGDYPDRVTAAVFAAQLASLTL